METTLPIDSIIHGDALEVLRTLESNSVDALCTDPPAGIGFMQSSTRTWDSDKGGRDQWVSWLSEIMREAMRVMRPGAHGLIWSLPRTSHWTMTALEDAGFTIRDNIYNIVSGDTTLHNFVASLNEEQQHAFMQIVDGQRGPSGILQIFGSKFPKSANISAMIDKRLGKEREIIGESPYNNRRPNLPSNGFNQGGYKSYITAPATEVSQRYNGFGTALKPSVENWILVRKPLAASSIAENVLKYGVGAINIAATRVGVSHLPKNPVLEVHGNVDADTLSSWLGIPLYCDLPSVSVKLLHDALLRISSALHSYNTACTSLLRDEVGQDGTLPYHALYGTLLNHLYPNGSWCALDLKQVLSFQGDCPACSHFCDGHAHASQESALVSAASLADALECMSLELSELQRSLHHQCTCHPSISGALDRILALIRLLCNFSYYTTYSFPLSRKDKLVRTAIQRNDNEIYGKGLGAGTQVEPSGRFPSHLLLTHHPQCIQSGTKKVNVNDKAHTRHSNIGKMGYGGNTSSFDCEGYTDKDGMETVAAWQCVDECPVRILDLQSGQSKDTAHIRGRAGDTKFNGNIYKNYTNIADHSGGHNDQGGASRYFQQLPALDDVPPYIYAGKASRKDRNAGLDDMPKQAIQNQVNDARKCRKCGKWYPKPMRVERRPNSTCICEEPDFEIVKPNPSQNTHPTVKSVHGLMRYLVRLIAPPNGIVLDCFAGSGSTLCAAIYEGFHFIGIEKEQEYIEIAQKRIEHAVSTVNNNTLQSSNIQQQPTAQPINTKPDIAQQKPRRKPKQTKQDNDVQQYSLWNDEITA